MYIRNRDNTSNTNKKPIKVTILRSSTCLDVVNQLPKGIRMYYNQNKNSYYVILILSNVIRNRYSQSLTRGLSVLNFFTGLLAQKSLKCLNCQNFLDFLRDMRGLYHVRNRKIKMARQKIK